VTFKKFRDTSEPVGRLVETCMDPMVLLQVLYVSLSRSELTK